VAARLRVADYGAVTFAARCVSVRSIPSSRTAAGLGSVAPITRYLDGLHSKVAVWAQIFAVSSFIVTGCAGDVVTRPTMVDDPHDEILGPDTDESQERRRPSRQDVSEELIPLLPNPADASSFVVDEIKPTDDLSPARGFVMHILTGALIWIGIGLGIFALFR
jgi:hypothetical protein